MRLRIYCFTGIVGWAMNRNFFASNCKQRINLHFAIPNNRSYGSYRLFPLPPSLLSLFRFSVFI